MYRILEFVDKNKVKPVGGPNGYVYNLISEFNSDEIELVMAEGTEGVAKKVGGRLPKFLKNFLNIFYGLRKVNLILKGNKTIVNINYYDAIHFHRTIDLVEHINQLKNFKGRVLLTSHSPYPTHIELYNDYFSTIERAILGKTKRKKYEKIDELAFNRADYIVFPCKEAEESYFANWDKYAEIHERNKYKYHYLLTGCEAKIPQINKDEIRSQYDITNKFVVSYIGRHTYAKGYDLLKDIAKIYLSDNKDTVFLICGKEWPLKGLEDSAWIEVGWTKEAASYVNASDVFILPNRETYFDLVFLEVLSLGKIIVASKTGGNKYFEQFKDSGIFLYETKEEACQLLDKIKLMSQTEKLSLSNKNKLIYENYFSSKVFAENYNKLYLTLLGS